MCFVIKAILAIHLNSFLIFDNLMQKNGTRLMALLTFTANETGGIDFTIITFEGKKPPKIGQ